MMLNPMALQEPNFSCVRCGAPVAWQEASPDERHKSNRYGRYAACTSAPCQASYLLWPAGWSGLLFWLEGHCHPEGCSYMRSVGLYTSAIQDRGGSISSEERGRRRDDAPGEKCP